ncbi:MAG: ornithine carbamoyltransferase [Pseudomonadota bacterium]|nr:ornithine carbamoyltransferase [Pseudomonadota bacterium]
MSRHFLSLKDLSKLEVDFIIQRAIELKKWRNEGYRPNLFEKRVLGMIFEKSSTRTRVSFESSMVEGGGGAIFLTNRDSQMGRGESIADTSRVISRMVDIIMIRTHSHEAVETFSKYSDVPVINGLTKALHPCQILADLVTYFEFRGNIKNKRVAWIGDGNNMCNSYIEAADLMDFQLLIACPKGFEPSGISEKNNCELVANPCLAADGADLVVTDVWASMGDESEKKDRERAFTKFEVNQEVMDKANSDALFMHCLPAYRGLEVSKEVLEGNNSVVWHEAENRLHSQKALIEFLLNSSKG